MTQGLGDTKERILDATAEVMARSGPRKLSLSDVAAAAKVSRPTLYRWFPSKDALLDAFARHEQAKYEATLAAAVRNAPRDKRLDAFLQAVVDYQHDYLLKRVATIEPEWAVTEIGNLLPVMREGMMTFFPGEDAAQRATAVTRIALSNMLIPEDDPDVLLAALRIAAGLSPS
jgi:AcrR family transcriptional regulator